MFGSIVLLVFLLIFAIGISTILYVCSRGDVPTAKQVHNFWVMAGWSLFAYLVFAGFVGLVLVDNLPAGG